ncbi:MAG: hypothetical protein LBJ35_02170 [Spirochaetaceae bacterium]|nr:hypothetical protein [Spirochaetaceae bacterium]
MPIEEQGLDDALRVRYEEGWEEGHEDGWEKARVEDQKQFLELINRARSMDDLKAMFEKTFLDCDANAKR